jgi:hypothetical protein
MNIHFPLHSLGDRLVNIEYRWNADRVKLSYSEKVYVVAALFATNPIFTALRATPGHNVEKSATTLSAMLRYNFSQLDTAGRCRIR